MCQSRIQIIHILYTDEVETVHLRNCEKWGKLRAQIKPTVTKRHKHLLKLFRLPVRMQG
jgi:hypothetical protein